MRVTDVKQWILSLASASLLTQMVFAQASVPAPLPPRSDQIILIQDKGPAIAPPPAPAVQVPMTPMTPVAPAATPDAKTDAPKGNGNGNGEEKKDEEKKDEGPWRLFPDEIAGFKVTGWIYGTGVYNGTNGGNTRYNGPMSMSDQEGVFLNQAYLSISRGLKDCFSWGATFDTFYGNDYNASQSRDWELRNARGWVQRLNSGQDYGIVSPQSYLEVGTTKYSLKVGHFWTPIGYMVVQAPGNFFNTQPYGFMSTNPFTHWGALGTANLSDNLMVQLGVVNGWDALDRPINVPSYLLNTRYTFNEKKGFLQYSIITGEEPENLGPAYGARTLQNVVFDYNISDKWEFVYESNLVHQVNHPVGAENSHSYNFQPFLFYRINDCWRAGIRYEYFHDPGNFMSGIRRGNPNIGPYFGNNQTVALGLNWTPNASKNLNIRPEYRYDSFSGTGQPYNAGNSSVQHLFVVGAFWQF
jgi:hypothetical protein